MLLLTFWMKCLHVSFREYIFCQIAIWKLRFHCFAVVSPPHSPHLPSMFNKCMRFGKVCSNSFRVLSHGKSSAKLNTWLILTEHNSQMSSAFGSWNANCEPIGWVDWSVGRTVGRSVVRCVLNFGILHGKISSLPSSLVNLSFCKRSHFFFRWKFSHNICPQTIVIVT